MVLPADSRPSHPQPETISIAELGQRLFALFSKPAPEAVTRLSQQYYIYHLPVTKWEIFVKSITTDHFSPDTPWIQSLDLHSAPEIITATISHHNLGFGPQTDLLVADHNPHLAVYTYPKRYNMGPVVPQPLTNFDLVRQLLSYQPDRWDDGTAIQLWNNNAEGFYTLKQYLSLKGLSLNGLLAQIKSS